MYIDFLLQSTLGQITLGGMGLIILLFFSVAIRTYFKTRKIIMDCDRITFPINGETLKKTIVGRLLLENELEQTSDYIQNEINTPILAAKYKINLRLFHAFPSILTSLGILGTFIGLAYSVVLFDSSSSESIRDSIETLLAGMGTAFSTSVTGMFTSILFLWHERVRNNRLNKAVDELCYRIDKQYHKSNGSLLNEGLQQVSNKIENLQSTFGYNLNRVFDQKVTPVMNEISRKLENPAQTVIDGLLNEFRRLSESFADILTEKVNNKMNDLLDQFILATDEMKGLPAAINTATDSLLKSSETAIMTQKAYTIETTERFDKYSENLLNSVKEQLKVFQMQFDEATGALGDIPEKLMQSVDAQKRVTDGFSQQIEKLGSVEEIFASAIEEITAANKDLATAKSNITLLADQISAAATSIKDSAANVAGSNTKMISDFKAIYELNREVTGQVKVYGEQISGIEKGLKGIFGEIERGLNNYAATTSKNMQGLLDVFTSHVTEACQSISNSTAPLHEIISGISNALDNTEKSVRSFLGRVEKLSQNKTN